MGSGSIFFYTDPRIRICNEIKWIGNPAVKTQLSIHNMASRPKIQNTLAQSNLHLLLFGLNIYMERDSF